MSLSGIQAAPLSNSGCSVVGSCQDRPRPSSTGALVKRNSVSIAMAPSGSRLSCASSASPAPASSISWVPVLSRAVFGRIGRAHGWGCGRSAMAAVEFGEKRDYRHGRMLSTSRSKGAALAASEAVEGAMPRLAAIARRLSPPFCRTRIVPPRAARFSRLRVGTSSARRAAESEENSSIVPSSDDRSSHWNRMISAGVVNGRTRPIACNTTRRSSMRCVAAARRA